jgi:hypothetical protein
MMSPSAKKGRGKKARKNLNRSSCPLKLNLKQKQKASRSSQYQPLHLHSCRNCRHRKKEVELYFSERHCSSSHHQLNMTDFTTEEDTDLLMAASQVHVPASTNKATNNNTESNSNTDALARSNLLRLEITELIREATLHLHPHGNESSIHYEAKWAPIVRGYISNLSSVLTSLDKCSLSPDVCLISSASAAAAASSATGGGVKDKGMKRMSTVDDDTKTYRVPLQSDKFLKSLPAAGTTSNSPTPWNFPFSGKVKLVPVGSYAHIGNAGLTNRHANGNVLPTLDLAILVKGGDGDDAFVGGKDYLNHRYTDVSCLVVLRCDFCVL